MKKMQVIDLYSIKYDAMTGRINEELLKIQNSGNLILDVKVIGDSLNRCAVFVFYEEKQS